MGEHLPPFSYRLGTGYLLAAKRGGPRIHIPLINISPNFNFVFVLHNNKFLLFSSIFPVEKLFCRKSKKILIHYNEKQLLSLFNNHQSRLCISLHSSKCSIHFKVRGRTFLFSLFQFFAIPIVLSCFLRDIYIAN